MILSDEYQTPRKYIIAAKEVMGSIDLDLACSNENAVRLKKYITNYFNAEINALKQTWTGNCWLNPPYSKPNLTGFTSYLVEQHKNFSQLTYLIPSYTSERWYHKCLYLCSALCLPNHRIEHLINGKFQTAPRFASTFFYFGHNQIRFAEVFSQFGKCFLN